MKKHCIVPTTQCEEENVKIWNCFWVGELGLSVSEDGTVNHDDYNIILARNSHFWFTELFKREDRALLCQKKKVPTAVLIRMQGDQKRESVNMIKEYLKGDEGSFLKQKEISVNNPDRLHLLKMYLVSELFFHLKDITNNNQRIWLCTSTQGRQRGSYELQALLQQRKRRRLHKP